MAENFSIEHSRTKITEVKKTIEDKKQKLDELKQQKKSLMDAGLALDSSNLDSAVQATLMESINDSLRDVENKAYDVSKDANQNRALNKSGKMLTMKSQIVKRRRRNSTKPRSC